MSQIRSHENSLSLSRMLSFPNFIEEQEKLKEEDEGFEVPNHILLDYSYIRYGYFTLGIHFPKSSFIYYFQELQILGFLLYKMNFLPNTRLMIFNEK